MDLNHRPLGYEPNELPDCSTPQLDSNARWLGRQTSARMMLARMSYTVLLAGAACARLLRLQRLHPFQMLAPVHDVVVARRSLAAAQMLEHLFQCVAGIVSLYANRAQIAGAAQAVPQLRQRIAALQRQTAGELRTAHQILHQQQFVEQHGSQEQTSMLHLPELQRGLLVRPGPPGAPDGMNSRKLRLPVHLGLLAAEVVQRYVAQPARIVQIQIRAYFFQPFEKGVLLRGLLFQHDELIVRRRQRLHQVAPQRIGGFAAFDAMSLDARMPFRRRSTVGTRLLVLSRKKGPRGFGRSEFLEGRRIALDFSQRGLGRQTHGARENLPDAGHAERSLARYN